MKIGHNLMATNAIRNANINSLAAGRSMQKLSSGLAITTAADDAAGLAISEKMKGQIRGLKTAANNAQDAVSLVQTADGALNETTSVLQRMRELAVQAANDTNTAQDRAAIQTEVKALVEQLDNIANTTQFNTKNLLDGSLGKATEAQGTILNSAIFTNPTAGTSTGSIVLGDATTLEAGTSDQLKIAVDGEEAVEIAIGALTDADKATTINAINTAIDNNANLKDKVTASLDAEGHIVFTSAKSGNGSSVVVTAGTKNALDILMGTPVDVEGSDAVVATADTKLVDLKDANGNSLGLQVDDEISISFMKNGSEIKDTLKIDDASTMSTLATKIGTMAGATVTVTIDGKIEVKGADGLANRLSDMKMNVENRLSFNAVANSFTTVQAAQDNKTDSSLTMQIGANAGQSMAISIGNMNASALLVSDLDLTTAVGAEMALKSIDNATAEVSSERAKLGAYQNRLESTINNLGTTAENLTSAQSSITDVDMAAEMAEFSKNNVLSQAAQAMLAQANQQPQQVLRLLQ